MTIHEVKDLKDKIYEIEGLLELAQLREEKLPELAPLILERIKALVETAEDATVENPEPAAPALEIESEEESLAEDLDAEAYEALEEEEITPLEAEEPATFTAPQAPITELFADSELMSVSREPEDLEIPEMETPQQIEMPQQIEAPKEEVITVKPARVAESRPVAGKPAFTLNDRFRFRRELFNNSDAEYSSAMDLIAAMESYEEAEEYFLDDLGWSLDNPEVKDFMDILRNYFN